MSFHVVDVQSIPAGVGPHPAGSPYDRRVSEALGLTAFEMYQVELPPHAQTVLHDHLADRVQDAYAVVGGSGWVVVDSEEVAVAPGHFIAVTVESARLLRAGGQGLTFIAVCARPKDV